MMRSEAALRLLERIVAHATTDGRFEVLPVLVCDLSTHLDLFAAAIRHAGGWLVAAEQGAAGVDGELDRDLATVAEATITLSTLGPVTFEARSDRVVALADGLMAETLGNTSAATLLGTVSALFAKSIRTSRLAAIAYDETSLDAEAADALWQLLTAQLPRLGLGDVRCLIVFVGVGAVNYARHCRPPVAARYRLCGDLAERHDWVVDRAAIFRLPLPSDRPVVLFLGAGFSSSSGLPLGNELRDVALVKLVGGDGEASLDELVSRFIRLIRENDRVLADEDLTDIGKYRDQLTLERVLREERQLFEPAAMPTLRHFAELNRRAQGGRGPSVTHLRSMLAGLGSASRLVVATVNFDTLLEEDTANLEVIATDNVFAGFPAYLTTYLDKGGRVPYLKLHGSITEPGSIVANVDDTMAGLSPERYAALMALARIRGVTVLYVGYSMRDLDLGPVLGQPLFAQEFDETWVMPFPEHSTARFIEQHRNDAWTERKLRAGPQSRTITQTADVFFRELAVRWGRPDE